MTSNFFGRIGAQGNGARSFYEELRNADDDEVDIEHRADLYLDEENLRHHLNDLDDAAVTAADSRITVDSVAFPASSRPADQGRRPPTTGGPGAAWLAHDDELDNDVPASLLVEPNRPTGPNLGDAPKGKHPNLPPPPSATDELPGRSQAQWAAATEQQRLHHEEPRRNYQGRQPRSIISGTLAVSNREKALWRWVNTTNLDSFIRGVYDYYEGGGLWCILVSNALWLL
jgi:autophagy-related protein 9